jgi:hypothetical protein
METTPQVYRHQTRLFLCCPILLGLAATAAADPLPLSKEEQAKVDHAIDRAVSYLKRTQMKEGDWPKYFKNEYLVGQCALPAYALLEAGVAANDPVIQKAADFLRPKVLKTPRTYELSLAVLFFDRLGDPKDKNLIQSLALRLIAGQYYTGGWSYLCPKLSDEQEGVLLRLLVQMATKMKEGRSCAEAIKDLNIPRDLKRLAVFQNADKLTWQERSAPADLKTTSSLPLVGMTDNSNTQFAMLALWAAQRHGVSAESSFHLVMERFNRSQIAGGWGYFFGSPPPSPSLKPTQRRNPSMICVGLLGLAIGQGMKLAMPKETLPGGGDIRVATAFAILYEEIGVPRGQMTTPAPLNDYYFLWSVERVGILYRLPTIGDKDWYRWGAEILVTNQTRDGGWPLEMGNLSLGRPTTYGRTLNTAFALLFLTHSNPMKDLVPKLPFTGKELNQGIARLQQGENSLRQSPTAPSQSNNPKP